MVFLLDVKYNFMCTKFLFPTIKFEKLEQLTPKFKDLFLFIVLNRSLEQNCTIQPQKGSRQEEKACSN